MGCFCSKLSSSQSTDDVLLQTSSRPVVRAPNLNWNSDKPMTLAQWKKEVTEFWETAPSYNGRIEVWQVLKSVCESIKDINLVNVLLDAAQITVPTGNLLDGAYDTLGNHYSIPRSCFSPPLNLISDPSPKLSSTTPRSITTSNGSSSGSSSSTTTTIPLKPFKIHLKSNEGDTVTFHETTTQTTIEVLKNKLQEKYSSHLTSNSIAKENIYHFFYLGQQLAPTKMLGEIKFMDPPVLQYMVISPHPNN